MTLLINYLKSVIELFRSGQGSDGGPVTANGFKPNGANNLGSILQFVANDVTPNESDL